MKTSIRSMSRPPFGRVGVLFALIGLVAAPVAMSASSGLVELVVDVRAEDGAPVTAARAVLLSADGEREERPVNTSAGVMRFETPLTGERTLRVFAEGHFEVQRDVTLTSGEDQRVTVTLEPFHADRSLTVLATREGPASRTVPLEFAEVDARWSGFDASGTPRTVRLESVTDATGRYVTGLPAHGELTVDVEHDFHEASETTPSLTEGDVRVVTHLPLKDGHKWVTGRVTSADGDLPVAGAHVNLRVGLGNPDRPFHVETRSFATTGADGAFTLASPHAPTRVVAEHEDHHAGTTDVPLNETNEVLVRLDPLAERDVTLTGVIVDEARDAPLEGAVIEFLAWDGTRSQQDHTRTTPDGGFTLAAPAGPLKLFVSCAPPACNATGGATLNHVLRVDARAPELDLGVIPLAMLPPHATGEVTGVVAHPDGTPLEGALVFIFDPARERSIAHVTTRPDGGFALPAFDAPDLLLVVRGPGVTPDAAGVLKNTGYASVVHAFDAPGAHDVGTIPLPRAAALDAVVTFHVTPDTVHANLTSHAAETGPLVERFIVDAIVGNGDGRVDDVERARAVSSVSSLHAFPLEAVRASWNRVPLALHADEPRLELADDGALVIKQAARFVPESPVTHGDFTVELQRPARAALRVEGTWSLDAPARTIGEDSRVLGAQHAWSFKGENAEPAVSALRLRFAHADEAPEATGDLLASVPGPGTLALAGLAAVAVALARRVRAR